MMKKWVFCLLFGMLLLASVSTASLVETSVKDSPGSCLLDDLDQFQDVYEEDNFLPVGAPKLIEGVQINFSAAQSFIPEKEFLSRVELLLARNDSTTYPLQVMIRDDLYGPVLTAAEIPATVVPVEAFDWISINFPDLPVVVGQTYYIMGATANISDNYYGWAGNTDGFSYLWGCAWMSIDDGKTWGNSSTDLSSGSYGMTSRYMNMQPLGMFPDYGCVNDIQLMQNGTWDMCFRTYGFNEGPLVEITKPALGIYLANEWLCYFAEPVIIGVIRIEVDALDHSGIQQVQFYIDEMLVQNSSTAPFQYLWSQRVFFKHFIKVVVEDTIGMTTTVELEVWKFF
ncbi:MAG: hypothetical protein KKC68_09345 [Candidatus Thermoplasmatota archaeon]|nr:hypothetical protein [Candidatus Thermoplasmatota archaeon]MBU1941963.1 hypothetical protein [Candidatus Thermoplasmatota archaeon]